MELSIRSFTRSRSYAPSVSKKKKRHKHKNNDTLHRGGKLLPIPFTNSIDEFYYAKREELSPFQRIDIALGKYYKMINSNINYFNEDRKGKFLLYVKKHGFNENEIDDELGDGVRAKDSMYIEMDKDFPLFDDIKINNLNEKHEAIFSVLQYCYKYK